MAASDDELARDLAVEAGRRLLELRASGTGDLRDAGDRLAHEFLTGELARRRPDDAVLSEEGQDDPARLAAQRVWIVDPLDGTREFGEAGPESTGRSMSRCGQRGRADRRRGGPARSGRGC